MILPVTLTAAAAAAIINIWLSMRIGRLRMAHKISIGDDAGGPLTARMRAQLNFVENTAFVLVLIAAVYMLGRVAHGFGMDGGRFGMGRSIGTAITMLTQLGLAIVAVLIALGRF